MLTSMTKSQRIKTTIKWMLRLLRESVDFILGRKRRFILLTPAILRNQVIYDRERKKFIRVSIRDNIDYYVVSQIFVNHDYGLEKLTRGKELNERYQKILQNGKTPLIIDCGANSGMATRYFTETYEKAFIVGVEPDETNLSLAQQNNSSDQISFLLAGIGCCDTKANLQDPGQGNWAYRVETSDDGSVEIVSINTLLKQYDADKFTPFIVKIDIEGFEENLFQKNTDWIDLFPLLIIELHDWMLPGQGNSKNLLQQVSIRNRDFVFHGENVFSISNTLL